MTCNPYTITVSSINLSGNGNNGAAEVLTSNNGSFLSSDSNNILKFVTTSNNPISDSAGLGYYLTILNPPFQGKISQTITGNNPITGNDAATLTGVINVTTPTTLGNNTTNPKFTVNGYLSSPNFSVYADNNNPLILTITLDSTSICSVGTYGGVIGFTVTIAGSQITTGNNYGPVTLTSQIVQPSTLSINPNDFIVDQILSSVNSNSNSIQSLSDLVNSNSNSIQSLSNSLNQLSKNLFPPKLNIKVL